MALSFALDLALNDLVLVDPEVSLVAHPLVGLVVYVVAVLVLSRFGHFTWSVLIRICSIERSAYRTHCVRQRVYQGIVHFVSVFLQVLDKSHLGHLILHS